MELLEVGGKDFGPFSEFSLQLHNQGLVWIGGVNNDSKAAKSNGSGKSHIFKAITWCLWGEAIDKEVGDKVIRNGTKEATVYVKLGGGWKVCRVRRKGSPRLSLITPEGESWKAIGKDVQEKINELVGLDFKAFKNTVLYGQNDSLRFANPSTRDGDRKDMLHKILRTELLKHCHNWVKEQSKQLNAKLSDVQSQSSSVKARLEEQDVSGLQEEHDEWEEERQEAIEEHKESARLKKSLAEAELKKTVDVSKLKLEIKKLNAVVEEGVVAERDIAALDKKLDVLRFTRENCSNELARMETKIEGTIERLEQMDEDECPICRSPMGKGVALRTKKNLEKIKSIIESEAEEKKANIVGLAEDISRVAEERKAKSKIVSAATDASGEISDLNAKIMAATAVNDRVDAYIAAARESLKQAKAKAAEKNPYAARLATAESKAKAFQQRLHELQEKESEISNELAHVKFWVKGFSGAGLPSFILDSVMPYITERANHYLGTLADGDIKLNFDTQRELKSSRGEYKDEIEISWEIEGASDTYPASGGQLKKIEIATDLALMDLVATREGGHVDLLMLDEVLDGLDEEGRQRVLMLLQELRAKRGSIFVISHEVDMAEIFEKSVMVKKDGGAAILELAA